MGMWRKRFPKTNRGAVASMQIFPIEAGIEVKGKS